MFDSGITSIHINLSTVVLIAVVWTLLITLWSGNGWRKEKTPGLKLAVLSLEAIFIFVIVYCPFLLLALAWWLGWL